VQVLELITFFDCLLDLCATSRLAGPLGSLCTPIYMCKPSVIYPLAFQACWLWFYQYLFNPVEMLWSYQ